MPAFAGTGLLAAVLIALAFEAGGYFAVDHLAAGAVCFGGVALLGGVALPRMRPTGHALVALGMLAAFAGWTALSAAWSPLPDDALRDFQRTLVYVGVLALALLAAGTGRHAPLLPWAALGVCLVVVGAGLVARLDPGLLAEEGSAPGYRLSHPLTYWNAFGGMAAFGTVLAIGLAADPRARAWVRSAGAAAAVPLGVAMYLSLSRGSWVALLAGVTLLVLVSPYRVSVLTTAGLVLGATALCVLRLEALDGLTESPTAGGGQADDGRAFIPFLALVVSGVAFAQLVIAHVRSSGDVQELAERVRGRVLAAGAGAAVLLAVVAYAVAGGALEGRSAEALDKASNWVDRQWDDFLLTSTFSEAGADRLLTSRGTRSDLYRVAWDGFQAHPLHGDGAGGFEWRWYQAREVQEDTREPHSLWLGTFGELGLVGVALLLGFVASVGWGAARSLANPGGLTRGQTAAVAAACTVWAVHSAVDWDWEMPAFTGTVVLVAAALLPSGRSRRRRRSGRGAVPG